MLSGAQSTDLDGRVVMHRWTVDDTVLVGEDVVLIVEATTEVSLTVIDEHGGTSTAAITLTPTTGPSVQSLVALHDGEGAVELTWTWDGEPAVHHIYRNGAMIGTTNATGFTDRPPMSGANTYTVQPVNDDRTFQRGSDDVSVLVNDVDIVVPEPATGLGYGLGGLMIFVLVLLQALAMRSGGGRT